MRLTVLGSAAAEGIPGIFCACATCQEAWKRGGKDLRTRTAYALGERIRVDLGPDSLVHDQRYGLHSERLRHLIVTHGHGDHLDSNLLTYRAPWASHVDRPLTVYGGAGVMARIRTAVNAEKLTETRMNLVTLEPFAPVTVKDEALTIHPLPANHMKSQPGENPFIYLLHWHGRHLLIANDTGVLPEESWRYLERVRPALDLAVLDCTMGRHDVRGGHMGCQAVVETVERLRAGGLVAPGGVVAANHFSHNGGMLHEDYTAFFEPHGMEVCWDGRHFDLSFDAEACGLS